MRPATRTLCDGLLWSSEDYQYQLRMNMPRDMEPADFVLRARRSSDDSIGLLGELELTGIYTGERRTVPIPCDGDWRSPGASAVHADGVLTVSVPKKSDGAHADGHGEPPLVRQLKITGEPSADCFWRW